MLSQGWFSYIELMLKKKLNNEGFEDLIGNKKSIKIISPKKEREKLDRNRLEFLTYNLVKIHHKQYFRRPYVALWVNMDCTYSISVFITLPLSYINKSN